jgi:hypothetical protein
MNHHPITNSRTVGTHPDGTPARMWTEGPRVFIEGYGYTKAASGISYGAIQVREITPTTAS